MGSISGGTSSSASSVGRGAIVWAPVPTAASLTINQSSSVADTALATAATGTRFKVVTKSSVSQLSGSSSSILPYLQLSATPSAAQYYGAARRVEISSGLIIGQGATTVVEIIRARAIASPGGQLQVNPAIAYSSSSGGLGVALDFEWYCTFASAGTYTFTPGYIEASSADNQLAYARIMSIETLA
jgi:hypothetical protein